MVLGVRRYINTHPTFPERCVLFHWNGSPHQGADRATVEFTDADGQVKVSVISSGTPAGVIARLETWLKKNPGADPRAWIGRTITVKVMGEKAITITPRDVGMRGQTGWTVPMWVVHCDVSLWWLDKEYPDRHGQWATCVWDTVLKRARKKKVKS